MLAQIAIRSIYYSSRARSSNSKGNGAIVLILIALIVAGALRKISADPDIEAVKREDVAQLFIEHPGKQAKSGFNGLSGLFATHPPIQKRIEVLEQF